MEILFSKFLIKIEFWWQLQVVFNVIFDTFYPAGDTRSLKHQRV